jgi:hypothetical protein
MVLQIGEAVFYHGLSMEVAHGGVDDKGFVYVEVIPREWDDELNAGRDMPIISVCDLSQIQGTGINSFSGRPMLYNAAISS